MAFYPAIPASDGTSMTTLENAEFKVYELGDNARINPLPLVSEAGLNAAPLVTTAQGVVPPVNVLSPNFSHVFVSGEWEWRRDSFDGAEAAVKEAVDTANVASMNAVLAQAAAERAAFSAEAPAKDIVVAVLTSEGPAKDKLRAEFGRRNANEKLSSGNVAYSYLRDTGDGLGSTFLYEDTPEHRGSVMSVRHYGKGEGGNQAYGINIANHPEARNALAIHQYSKAAPAVQIDNTDIASGIYIKNTENQTQNPGGRGTGGFLQFKPFSETDALFLTDGLQWLNRTSKDMSVAAISPTNYTFGVLASAPDKQGLYVGKSGTGAGAAVSVSNTGIGNGVSIVQNGLSEALKITTTAAAAGVYAARINGQGHGLVLDTANDGGNTLDVDKKGTGNGIAFKLRNLGTGDTISMLNGTGVVARFSAAGEYETLTNGAGIILRNPAGARYRVSVDNTGAVKATAI